MGRRLSKLRRSKTPVADGVDFDERAEASYLNKSKYLEGYVEEGLFHARAQNREEALSKIIEAFTNHKQHEIAERKFGTIMLRCLNLVKKGSAKEICLASKVIGLLAMIIGPGDNAHELYEESLSTYSQVLNLESKSINVLKSFAIVNLVGTNGFEDTERSMKILWQFIAPNSGSNIVANKDSALVLTAAISAWSFLLTTINVRMLDHKYWQGAISYFLNLLEEEESLRAAAVEALAIIFEKGCDEKFSSEAYKAFIHSSTHKEDTTSCSQEWKNEILERVKKASDSKSEFSKFFEHEYRVETSMNIGGKILTFSTLSLLKKMKFLKQFLGYGFVKHMLENELLHEVFDFTPKSHLSGPELYVPETEEVSVRYFLPDIRKIACGQRLGKSPNSVESKAKTQLMKKKRVLAQRRKIVDFEG